MPPHCDSMDGPVVKAARQALDLEDVNVISPFAPREGEAELTEAFNKAVAARKHGPEAKELADRFFFETAVRIHRAGEGAPFTGLKPAGLDMGPVIPAAEKAVETGAPDDLMRLVCDVVREELRDKFERAMSLKSGAGGSVQSAREYTSAVLGFEVFAHKLYKLAKSGPHEAHGVHETHVHRAA